MILVFILILLATVVPGPDRAEAEARLEVALQLAREKNDEALVKEVRKLGRELERAFQEQEVRSDGVETALRAIEAKVGIDPGGWSMAGQPLFHPTAAMRSELPALRDLLSEAMESGEPARVREVTAQILALLGDQAGVPDGRRAGRKAEPVSRNEAEATKLFLDALASEEASIRRIREGKPLPGQMLRLYASVLSATVTVRPFVERHQPASLADLDRLTRGAAEILTGLQQPSGLFPFPDLRGENIRFGEMIEKQSAAGGIEVRDGWIVSADSDGGSQFDTGLCGVALLEAGACHKCEDWKLAGLRAADWALTQPCCANFNYNAFSVSLLARAFAATGEEKYLDGALRKFRVGLAPGQSPNGRWLDPHNARTVYHLIILRGLGELATVLPADQVAEREELKRVMGPAIRALLDEFDAMGHTVEALPELQILAALDPGDERLRQAVREMASGLIAKCSGGGGVRMGAQPHQLAAVLKLQSP
ncbi:MAG: hypothetical protein DVB23_000072 [Verrucomicrobia bacterium]|nr:MAG: hypothetical protein DVB23_000072 [Verrucomicrobiota bacterium]